MDQWWLDAGRYVAGQWGAAVIAVFWAMHHFGVFRTVRRAWNAEAVDRQRLARDQVAMIDRLQTEQTELREMIDDLRRWRREDKAGHAAEIAEMRAECDEELTKLRGQIELLVKGEARWRHLVGNLAQYIDALRRKLREAGIEVVPFDGWRKFIEDGGELPDKYFTAEAQSR